MAVLTEANTVIMQLKRCNIGVDCPDLSRARLH
jgi:hypothetical protein